jgi:hypothetical protein
LGGKYLTDNVHKEKNLRELPKVKNASEPLNTFPQKTMDDMKRQMFFLLTFKSLVEREERACGCPKSRKREVRFVT